MGLFDIMRKYSIQYRKEGYRSLGHFAEFYNKSATITFHRRAENDIRNTFTDSVFEAIRSQPYTSILHFKDLPVGNYYYSERNPFHPFNISCLDFSDCSLAYTPFLCSGLSCDLYVCPKNIEEINFHFVEASPAIKNIDIPSPTIVRPYFASASYDEDGELIRNENGLVIFDPIIVNPELSIGVPANLITEYQKDPSWRDLSTLLRDRRKQPVTITWRPLTEFFRQI